MKRLSLVTLLLLMLVAPLATRAQDFDRNAMLMNLVENVILPKHAAFVDEAAALESTLFALESDPTPQTLSDAQNQWVITTELWSEIVIFSSQRLMVIQNQIHKPPANTGFIDNFIHNEANINAELVAGVGSTSKGLPAIEYLIFDPESDAESILQSLEDPNRMAYLVSLGDVLHSTAQDLYAMWSPDDGNYADAFIMADEDGAVLRSSISMLNNELVAVLETIIHTKIGIPLGTRYDTDPDGERAEAFRSQTSNALMIHNLIGLRDAFMGGDGPGLHDYLDFLGAESADGASLSGAITARIDDAIAAFEAQAQPLSIAVYDAPDDVAGAQAAVTQILILVKVDMANHLGVTITFSDNDGD